ncbi:MAG: hypothetical protein NTW47_17470 [Proteobacteria bacterium]|nr:hypothetical protein [Pseudomonadota bacterium]
MFARLLITPLAVLATTSAYAQSYPDKAMRMIVPFSAGAGTDLLSRVIARKLQEAWGRT